ncbi:unnamed protein product [Caretta caretta]
MVRWCDAECNLRQDRRQDRLQVECHSDRCWESDRYRHTAIRIVARHSGVVSTTGAENDIGAGTVSDAMKAMDAAPAAVWEVSMAVEPTNKEESAPAWAAASSGLEIGTGAVVVEVLERPGALNIPPHHPLDD